MSQDKKPTSQQRLDAGGDGCASMRGHRGMGRRTRPARTPIRAGGREAREPAPDSGPAATASPSPSAVQRRAAVPATDWAHDPRVDAAHRGTPLPGELSRAAVRGQAVQRRAAVPTTDWAHDPWVDAAHRGTPLAADPAGATTASPRADAAVQRTGAGADEDAGEVHHAAAHGVRGSGGALPHLDRVQQAFGPHDVSNVQAYTAPDACETMGADAYATGERVAFARAPDLHTAAHEAAHVVQQRSGVELAGGVGRAGDRYERHADAVAERVVRGESAVELLGASPGRGAVGASSPLQRKASGHAKSSMEAEPHGKDASARFEGDNALEPIYDGKETLSKGAEGIKVVKMQQALLDMGYELPKYGVDGKFGDETRGALLAYQKDAKVPETGVFDQPTIAAMDTRFDTRQDYLDAAGDFDKADPTKGTRALTADQESAAVDALKPQPGTPGLGFQETVGGKRYGDEIKARLTTLIPELHKELYSDKEPLRADPKKNFHKDESLEDAANAGKDATDQVYGALNHGPAFEMGVNLIDQWQDEEDRNKLLNDAEKREKAKGKVEYLIDANCADINSTFNATPSDPKEAAILAPIITSFIDTPAKVQIMLDIETGWEGAQLQGVQYLQLYKDPSAEANRLRLWELFHVSIHEYIHTLAAPKYKAWAQGLGGSQEHTLIEGFCDFFTLNVRAKFPTSALKPFKKQVEGDFHDPAKDIPDPSTLAVGVYSSNEEAERMVGIIGINNAQLGYFRGETALMGG